MKPKLFVFLLICASLIAACGSATTPEPTPDVAAVRTSAASTVVSQFTLTAAAFTPTPQPLPTETTAPEATATEAPTEVVVAEVTNAQGTTIALSDKYSWDVATVDVNIPDNTVMTPGQDFTKTWLIKNIGSVAWGKGYKLVYSYSNPPKEKMSGEAQPLTAAIAPGEEVQVSVNFKAPALPGTYTVYWTMQNAAGIAFQGNDNKPLYVQIIVQ